MLVNNLHWEGTNLAMISGKLAGETAIEALNKNDFSAKSLYTYEEKLKNSFVMKDLNTYKDLMDIAHKKSDAFLDYYLRTINAFFKMFTSVDSIPKRKKYYDFVKTFVKERKFANIVSDVLHGIKLLWSILKWY